ncbi:MAG: thymidylate synthase [Immundisolibacterales bacterium]|nr:thymidylate synthase [Immundisolibacterales bacterium]
MRVVARAGGRAGTEAKQGNRRFGPGPGRWAALGLDVATVFVIDRRFVVSARLRRETVHALTFRPDRLPGGAGQDHGKPINVASRSLLAMMVAKVAGYEPEEFVHTYGDVRLCLDHFEPADLQPVPEPQPQPLRRVRLRRVPASLLDSRYGDIELHDFRFHPVLRAPESV